MKTIARIFSIAVVAMALGSCSNDGVNIVEQPTQQASTKYTCKMELIGEVTGFDQTSPAGMTRATTGGWTSGDKIYIAFYNGDKIVPGEATYNASTGWSVSCDGNIATGSSLKCEARFFVNATQTDSHLVTINPNTEIYEDLNASYTYDNATLTVYASLAPKTGRIRFTGTNGAKIYLTGITTYTTFAPQINKFSTSEAMITQTVTADGTTPYIYGYLGNEERSISIVGNNFAFNRTCSSKVLKTGESGYMAIPSEASHNNWRSGLYVKVSGVEIKMIPVDGLASGFFLIGETEVTEALFNSVNGTPSTSMLPKDYVAYSTILSFIERLNNYTKLNFDLPTKEQWLYAAKGGIKSQNYTYCGSNTPDDVAWYKANASTKQNVKGKTPNELGIYDMSGNVAEFVKKYVEESGYGYYYSKWAFYGGSYKSSVDEIEKESNEVYKETNGNEADARSSTAYDYASYAGVGFRLILTCK